MKNLVNQKTVLICVSGGTGSGKSTISNEIKKALTKNVKSVILCQDRYYKTNSQILATLSKRAKKPTEINYDHPSSFDWDLLREQIISLTKRQAIDAPIYDYSNHARSEKTQRINPVNVIIFEGIYAYYDKTIFNFADLKIFVDTPAEERLIRRLIRDVNERGRTIETIVDQWRLSVRTMYNQFIAPQKEKADLVIPWHKINDISINAIRGSLNMLLKNKGRKTVNN